MSYEQRVIILFIIGVNVVPPEDRVNATNLILNACDESQVFRIKKRVDVLKSPSISPAEREILTKDLVEEILRSGESQKEGAD